MFPVGRKGQSADHAKRSFNINPAKIGYFGGLCPLIARIMEPLHSLVSAPLWATLINILCLSYNLVDTIFYKNYLPGRGYEVIHHLKLLTRDSN